ncbi:hypothetical protein ACFL30_04365, partial [Candidatus Latescibacterota bacterium]
LMPEFGYPPVQFGGWGSPRALWVRKTAAHNTVVVDGKDQENPRSRHKGRTTLWADGDNFRAIRASAPEFYGIDRYERTVALVDISDTDSYLLDVFRVAGGSDHAKFQHSYFGAVNVFGLSLQATEDYGYDTIMRNFTVDRSPKPGWQVEWKIEDHYNYLSNDSDVRIRFTDLTTDAEAYIAQGWISPSSYNEKTETWIPRLMVRRRADAAPLVSTFVSIIEPYEGRTKIASIRRLPLMNESGIPFEDSYAAVEVMFADGRRDLIIASDVKKSPVGDLKVVRSEQEVQFDGDLCLVRCDSQGLMTRVAMCGGTVLSCGEIAVTLNEGVGFVELCIDGKRVTVVSGERSWVRGVHWGERELKVE